jgi:integrase
LLPKRIAKNYQPKGRELQTYAANLPKVLTPFFSDALLFQLQTCARITEAASCPWSEIDLDTGIWTLAAARSKNGLAHVVMLSSQSIELLKRRRLAYPDAVFVFTSERYPTTPASTNTMMQQVRNFRTELGVDPQFTSHAIRHGMLTWMAGKQMNIDLRNRVSNHMPPTSSDSTYNTATLNEPARAALQQWCDFLNGNETSNVVPIGVAS